MAVIPGPSKPQADSSLTVGQINQLSEVTEDSILQQATNRMLPDFGKAGNLLFSAISDVTGALFGIIGGIANAVVPSWLPGPVQQQAQQIRDGQRDLLDRVDLLSPLLDRCSMTTPNMHHRIGNGRLPFTEKLGPSRGVTIMDNGSIRLDERGAWEMSTTVTASWMNILRPNVQVYLRVLNPDGGINSVYSEQGYWMTTTNEVTMTIVSSVVIEEPGYFVDVYVISPSDRAFWGGEKWTRLNVSHISNDPENIGGDGSTDPDDNPNPGPGEDDLVEPVDPDDPEAAPLDPQMLMSPSEGFITDSPVKISAMSKRMEERDADSARASLSGMSSVERQAHFSELSSDEQRELYQKIVEEREEDSLRSAEYEED